MNKQVFIAQMIICQHVEYLRISFLFGQDVDQDGYPQKKLLMIRSLAALPAATRAHSEIVLLAERGCSASPSVSSEQPGLSGSTPTHAPYNLTHN